MCQQGYLNSEPAPDLPKGNNIQRSDEGEGIHRRREIKVQNIILREISCKRQER